MGLLLPCIEATLIMDEKEHVFPNEAREKHPTQIHLPYDTITTEHIIQVDGDILHIRDQVHGLPYAISILPIIRSARKEVRFHWEEPADSIIRILLMVITECAAFQCFVVGS
jgi:hypothetical protein